MAARRTHVPKFGNWNANDHMPYTVVFDNARQGRGKPINPNDPSENPSMFPAEKGSGTPGRRPFNPNDPEDSTEGPDLPQERQERAPQGNSNNNREGSSRGQQQQQIAAGAAARRQVAAAPPAQANGMPTRVAPAADPKRVPISRDSSIESPSTSFSADQSPSHPAGYQGNQGNQGRGTGTRVGAASPAWESRRKSEDAPMFAPATPNRSRLRTGGNNSNKDDGSAKGPSAALPKFGAWDAQDPQSGDGFTVIFNNARNEKKTGGPVNVPRTPDNKHGDDLYENSHSMGYQKGNSRKSWFCWCSPDVKA